MIARHRQAVCHKRSHPSPIRSRQLVIQQHHKREQDKPEESRRRIAVDKEPRQAAEIKTLLNKAEHIGKQEKLQDRAQRQPAAGDCEASQRFCRTLVRIKDHEPGHEGAKGQGGAQQAQPIICRRERDRGSARHLRKHRGGGPGGVGRQYALPGGCLKQDLKHQYAEQKTGRCQRLPYGGLGRAEERQGGKEQQIGGECDDDPAFDVGCAAIEQGKQEYGPESDRDDCPGAMQNKCRPGRRG